MSIFALLLDTSVYLVISITGLLGPENASVIGYSCGLIFAYVYMKKYVFRKYKEKNKKKIEIILFTFSGLIGVIVTYLTVYAWIRFLNESLYWSKFFAVIISFFVVYIFRRKIVFPVA